MKMMFKMYFKDVLLNFDYLMLLEMVDKVMYVSFMIGDLMIMCLDGDCS